MHSKKKHFCSPLSRVTVPVAETENSDTRVTACQRQKGSKKKNPNDLRIYISGSIQLVILVHCCYLKNYYGGTLESNTM